MKEDALHIRVNSVLKKKAQKRAKKDGRTLSNWILSLVERELEQSKR